MSQFKISVSKKDNFIFLQLNLVSIFNPNSACVQHGTVRPYSCLSQIVMGIYLVAQTVKNLPAVQETMVQSLGREDLLEKGMATHSSIHGQKSLAGYTVHGVTKSSDMTERLTHLIPSLSGLSKRQGPKPSMWDTPTSIFPLLSSCLFSSKERKWSRSVMSNSLRPHGL